jgi:hypothetical protein
MHPEHIPFPPGWLSFDLAGYRPCDSTYCLFAYETLPPLPLEYLRDDFHWLEPLDDDLETLMQPYRPSHTEREYTLENLNQLISSAQQRNLLLPDTFIRFMGALNLQDRIPSCTACYFDLPDKIVACPVEKTNFIIRFLNDQQGVLAWYLYLLPNLEHCIIVSDSWYDELSFQELGREEIEAIRANTFFCAASFEEFLYRFWLENHLWFTLAENKKPLTDEQQRYLRHYTR